MGGWLCPTELDRQRLMDVSPRVRRARLLGLGFVGAGLLALAPLLSWWLLPVFAAATVQLVMLDRVMAAVRRPERAVLFSLAFTETMIGVGVALTGGPVSPLLPWMVIPAGMLSARFSGRVAGWGSLAAAAAVVAAGALTDLDAFLAKPELTIATLALLGNVASITAALRNAEIQHRTEAVLDPLTGLLNRKALVPRFAELSEQALMQGGEVCLIAADLDHFKQVNDAHGHDRGDAVLRDAAYAMRKALRTFELVYRLGGEEFLVVLPGVGAAEGAEVAERMRASVESARPGGLKLTASFGVAVARGAQVDFQALFADADGALYAAKAAGRNRVEGAARDAADRRRAGSPVPRPVTVAG